MCGSRAARWCEPLLLFHGSGADVSWRTWEPQMEAFGEVRRIYALDWPGWGDSAGVRPEGAERLDPVPMVELALRVMETSWISRVADVGGVSWAASSAWSWRWPRPACVTSCCWSTRPVGRRIWRRDGYAAVTQPVCLAWAEEDPIIPLSLGRALAAALPNCSLHTFPGPTHWPHHLHEDAFNEMAVAFLDMK